MCLWLCEHLGNRLHDLSHEFRYLGLDYFEGSKRLVHVEVSVEGDLVAGLGLVVVGPGVGDVGQDFVCHVGVDVVAEGHGLGVAQSGVRFGLAVGLAADFRVGVGFAERGGDRFGFGGAQPSAVGIGGRVERCEELAAVADQIPLSRLGERAEDVSDGLLAGLSGGDFGVVFGSGRLFARGELGERVLVLDAGDALGGGGEAEPQGAFDGDLAIAEVFVGEDLADRQRPGARLMGCGVLVGEVACLAVGEAAMDADVANPKMSFEFRCLGAASAPYAGARWPLPSINMAVSWLRGSGSARSGGRGFARLPM